MKSESLSRKIIITIISIILFYLIGRYGKINTGLYITYIFFQYPLLCIISILFGPVIGAITGVVGHILIDLGNSSYVWFSWVTATGVLAASLGLVSSNWLDRYPHKLKDSARNSRIKFALTIIGLCFLSFLIVGPTLEVLLYKATIQDAFTRGLFISVSNGLTSAIVTDLFFSSFRHTVIRRIFATLTLINALVLVSYGNSNVGSIILYVLTIIFGIFLFYYQAWHIRSKNKYIQIAKGILFFGFILYACEILFLAAFAYANRPLGTEKTAIVLGAGLDDEKPSRILKMRLDTALNWYMEDADRILITSGGQGSDEILPEGEAMRNYLIRNGVPADHIFSECKSTTTYENFKYSRDVLRDNNIDDGSTIVIITNNFHCFRAQEYAKIVGLNNVKTLASPTPVFGILPNFLREGFAFMKYMIINKGH